MSLRSLPDIERAARNQGLEVIPTLMREVLFACPQCKEAGMRALASATTDRGGNPTIRCKGCEAWGDDPQRILAYLGHDELEDDPFEIILRFFDLLWAMHKASLRATPRTGRIRDIRSGAQTPGNANADGERDRMSLPSVPAPTTSVAAGP